MKTVLFIKSSITGENSQSTKLALAVIEELKQKEGNIRVIERDLITAPPPHFSSEHLKAFSSSDKGKLLNIQKPVRKDWLGGRKSISQTQLAAFTQSYL